MTDSPLSGILVIDNAAHRGASCGRYFAELGADVVRIVSPPDAADTASRLPASVRDRLWHDGKREQQSDLTTPEGQTALEHLLARADIFLTDPLHQIIPEYLLSEFPALVTVEISEFGRTGPRAHWQANDLIHLAMSGFLNRSGLPGRPPFIPPGAIAREAACVQAAWCGLVAYWKRLASGAGDHIDFSIYDATVQSIDPAFGPSGTAVLAIGGEIPRGRVEAPFYPSFAASDGHVRIVCLSPRQWQALFELIGSPDELAGPDYCKTSHRFAHAERINAIIAAQFCNRSVAEILAEGQRLGLPIAPILSIADVLEAEQYRIRNAFSDVPVGDGPVAKIPSRYVALDAPPAGTPPSPWQPGEVVAPDDLPLAGLKVIDLGVIVMGGEAARLFADQGADVLKIESPAFVDGARGPPGAAMSRSFAVGHRNMRSLGLNLRESEGIALFRKLVASADVVLNNFKPGTMEKLALGYDELCRINPALVMVSCSAFGDTGPWKDWMGYGPLVRAATGLAGLWRDQDDPGRFGDTTLTYPDHFAGRIVDVAALACLIRRRQSGLGGHVRAAQAEAALRVLGEQIALQSLGLSDEPPGAPWGVFPCAGEDEWCAVTVQTDQQWEAICRVIGDPSSTGRDDLRDAAGRLVHKDALHAWLSAWTAKLSPIEVAETLQAAGIPAGPMQRGEDLPNDTQLSARRQFAALDQPGIAEPVTIENGPAIFASGIEPPQRPAPVLGQHTRQACKDWLGMEDVEMDRLIAVGVLIEARQDEPA